MNTTKPIHVTSHRKAQLDKLAIELGTTTGILVDTVISKMLIASVGSSSQINLKKMVAEIDAPQSLKLEILPATELDSTKLSKAIDTFTPEGWYLASLHKGGDNPFVAITMPNGKGTDVMVATEVGNTMRLASIILDVKENGGSGRVRTLSGGFLSVKRQGRGILFIYEKESIELAKTSLPPTPAQELSAALGLAIRLSMLQID